MNRRWLLCLVCFSLPVFCLIRITSARFAINVDERETRFVFKQLAPEVILAVNNGDHDTASVIVRLELLAPENKIVAITERATVLKPGRQKLTFALPLKTRDLSSDENTEVLWYRLRYSIAPQSGPDSETIGGLISLSQITPDLFEMRIASAGTTRSGINYQAKVLARHPLTKRPAPGVDVKGAITIDNHGKTTLTSSSVTDRNGYADLSFDLPAKLDADELEFKVEGTRGLATVKASRDVDIYDQPYVLVSTDKPLYQPGQTVHARVMLLGPSKRALATEDVELKITDAEDTVVFTADLTTSRFGIASADWLIPKYSRLGNYELDFSTNSGHSTSTQIKISRYDLPTFSVNAKTDRTYYQPGQDARVVVNAEYLFGKPVTRGHVRVVRETERTWNYREQKYDVTEGDKYEGDVGPDASFAAQIDLAADHAELKKEDYQRFVDLPYAAYFTDASTNRTEQRRFNLRLTRDAIHIYVIRSGGSYYDNARLPLRFYVSTFYADGEPAQCDVSISQPSESKQPDVLTKIKTNPYGVGKVEALQIPSQAIANGTLTMNLLVQDKAGRTGKHAEIFDLRDEPIVRVSTPRTVFARGEPVAINLNSSESDLPVTVSVIRDQSVVLSEVVRIRNHRASLLFPYRPEFKDELTIVAYADIDEETLATDSRSVIYPRNRDLRLKLQSGQSYKPGEIAHVSFEARNPEGRSVESALGIVVLDKAVEERIRTDQEFGSGYAGFYRDIMHLLGYGDSLGSMTRKVLEQIDRSKPIAADLDLAAEVLLNQNGGYHPEIFGSEAYARNLAVLFAPAIKTQITPLREALTNRYEKTREYPTDETSLRRELRASGIDFDSLKDPWGIAYQPEFFVDQASDVFRLKTAGADKVFNTADDFTVEYLSWPYFRQTGEAIDTVVREFHQRTGGFIRTFEVLREELKRKGIDADKLRDRWSKPYEFRFEVAERMFLLSAWTTVPHGQATGNDYTGEFRLWQSTIDYFAEPRGKIDAILANSFKATKRFPTRESELEAILQSAGFSLDKLKDPWARSYYATFKELSFYADRVSIQSQSVYGQPASEQIKIKPVTKTMSVITLRSSGADLKEGTADDFDVAIFNGTLTEQSAIDLQPQTPALVTTFNGATGAITGVITDAQGAIVPGATIEATRQNTQEVFSATCGEDGRFLLRNLPVGIYELRVNQAGFKPALVTSILVRSSESVEVNLTLDVGSINEVVAIVATNTSALNFTTSASVSQSKLFLLAPGLVGAKPQTFTPRLRDYFPETLLWQPELTTDKKGRAQLDFKLADNITTWKMSVIGSTEDGELGTAETEIRAFQPFFAELDPPRVLTEGDRISLPVVLRNYLDRKQTVNLELKRETWFNTLGANSKNIEVPAGDFLTQSFDIQATASVMDGKQRVTALGSSLSDAIEKQVTVHPDGQEKAEASSTLLENSTSVSVNLPDNAIANSSHVELKIYPNLMAHVFESVEGIMKRPYGCGEQTISSTYPSLLVLRYRGDDKAEAPIFERARRYLFDGYQRLLSYQSEDGGFSYWGRGDSNVALTAYAIRFLHDASTVITVDSSVIERARLWLISQQQQDGSWPVSYGNKVADERATAMLTAHVARSLAIIEHKQTSTESRLPGQPIIRALDYLERRSNQIDEPYLIAAYSLASSLANQDVRVASATKRLVSLAHNESSTSYWVLETNTPFYGWGLAGRIETTALVIQALGVSQTASAKEQAQLRDLKARGLLYLLRGKDRYGVWYSTQATINVLDAMLSTGSRESYKPDSQTSAEVEIWVNGQRASSVKLPLGTRITAPIVADLTGLAKTGQNQIELKRAGSGSLASVQLVATYYVPWANSRPDENARVPAGDSESLRLETNFDKTSGRVMEEITCRVKAERIGFRGYGMLLAEIGLPPGAEVDRASLENAMESSGWAISQYDVLPDRVVVYLWPRAGGSSFSFKFKPRFAMKAKAASSTLYDYYNPDAKALIAPATFTVQ